MNKAEKIKIILSIVGISFIQGLQFCVSPVLGQIQAHFPDVDISLVQMLVTAPALLSMGIALLSGWLVMKVSKKKMLLFAAFVAGVTGFLPLLADSFALLFASRLCYGVALGLATALNAAVVAEFFEGDERVAVMGIQAASVGAGMVIVTTVGGMLGSGHFEGAYFINIIGFLSLLVLAFCLPDTGKSEAESGAAEKIQLTGEVFVIALFGALEYLFLITFTTNIAMHISGSLAGSTAVSGNLTGIFSGAQIVIGLLLGSIVKIVKKYTLPVAMLCFCAGGVFLVCFPSSLVPLMVGAVLCGFSQGMFVPQAFVEVTSAVKPASATMASACFTCATCLGQVVSPTVLNSVSKAVFGETNTTNVYITAIIGMALAAAAFFLIKSRKK